jgi:hypothetical protein
MPPEDDGGAEVTAYVVRAFRQGSARVLTETFPAGQTQAIVEGLRAGSTYTFTVAAVNEVGEGPQSAPSAPVTTRPRA